MFIAIVSSYGRSMDVCLFFHVSFQKIFVPLPFWDSSILDMPPHFLGFFVSLLLEPIFEEVLHPFLPNPALHRGGHETLLVHSRLRWYGHVNWQDTKYQIWEVMKLEVGGKIKLNKINCGKNVWKIIWGNLVWNNKMQKIGKDITLRLKQKLPTPVCWNNGIKRDVAGCWKLIRV